VDWIHLAQIGANGSFCEHGNETSGSMKSGLFLEKLVTINFSRSLLCGVS
jgi:hypothetical protein